MKYEVVTTLLENGYALINHWKRPSPHSPHETIEQFFFSDGNLAIRYVSPHFGTDYQQMLQADTKEAFTLWANAPYETLFDTKDELLSFIDSLEQLKPMQTKIKTLSY